MINKQRVQRIRGFLYTCIFLILFLPIFLTMFFSFRTMDLLTKLTAQLAQNPPSYSQQAPGQTEPGQGNEPAAPQEQGLPEDVPSVETQSGYGQENGAAADKSPADQGRYVQNTYLPNSHPELYFDTLPETKALEEHTLYLTLDNTPSDRADEILGVLAKHDVNATFFVWWNPYLAEENNAFYRRLVAEGHQIGIHCGSSDKTFTQLYESVEGFLEEFSALYETVCEQTGVRPRLYRLPGGSVQPHDPGRQEIVSEIKAELDARGFLQFDWTASAQDAVSPSLTKEQILSNIRGSIGEGGRVILLAHDGTGSSSTAEALDELISQYRAEGFSFGVLENDSKPVSFLR